MYLGPGMTAARAIGQRMAGKKPSKFKKHRHHRRGLTAKRKTDLLWLKHNIGKTAAANYLAQHSV